MLDLLRVLTYPSVDLTRVNDLPKQPGIYYARKGLEVQYVGLSRSVHRRWNATGSKVHHRKLALQQMGGIRLHYRLCQAHELDWIEALEIRRFDPPLNVMKPIPERHLTWRIRIQSLPVVIGALAIAIVGLGIVEAIDNGRFALKQPNNHQPGDR
ncbi:hypothetical protein IQ235_09435 [Oscillatoriales cyanobacterium LEGE 11467]|uniref:GIY-YIG nuclease family protein n=1 Tax=Zarconia navalis LEGE 11467 TaxID=1828826 RepID=A0A928VVM7_9CYAN|nr:hypothetical protein [Zarconia navalis]MBE9041001.1 hypothetical protein [Zarconia navalis LEGE 11467]